MPTIIDGTDGVSKVDLSEIATGTPDATNFLRGDGSWQTIETTPTTAQVLAATAGAAEGAVGTYASAFRVASGTLAVGATVAGSSLRVVEGASGTLVTFPFGGTWRNMGGSLIGTTGYSGMMTTVLRIS